MPLRRLMATSLAVILTLGLAPPRVAATAIGAIQGSSHLSPLLGTAVTGIEGIVTRTITTGGGRGFYMQDPRAGGDGDAATSDGIFVFTGAAGPGVVVGDAVRVGGLVEEFRPGCAACAPTVGAFNNLTITQIRATPVAIARLSAGNPLPAPAVIGAGDLPPNRIAAGFAGPAGIEDAGYRYSPTTNAIDFYESLESMLVEVKGAVAVGPTNGRGEIPVLADGGVGAALRTARGGVAVAPGAFNGERVILDDRFLGAASMPRVKVGDRLGDVAGVMDYGTANYRLQLAAPPLVVDGGLLRERVMPAGPGELAIASFNVENLAGTSSAAKFTGLARQIVDHLGSPDIIGLSEIQDDNGTIDDGTVAANRTYARLIAAIEAAGGPRYAFRQIDPLDGADGGAPGANIRVGFLYDPATVDFVDKPGGDAVTATSVGPDGRPSLSPGRIDPADPAWSRQSPAPGASFGYDGARKPIVAEFRFGGRPITVVVAHLKSKTQDQPLFGRFQEPTPFTAAQRGAQAAVIADFVAAMLAADADAPIVLLGDYNDFPFSDAMAEIVAAGVRNLYELLPEAERYTYVFDGNSQALDHILASAWMLDRLARFDIVHVNSEFVAGERFSDHDPLIAVFDLRVPAPAPALLLPSAFLVLAATRARRAARRRRVTAAIAGDARGPCAS